MAETRGPTCRSRKIFVRDPVSARPLPEQPTPVVLRAFRGVMTDRAPSGPPRRRPRPARKRRWRMRRGPAAGTGPDADVRPGRIHPRRCATLQPETESRWDFHVIDDASPDDTTAAVTPFLGDARIHYRRRPSNRGVGVALNEGLDASTAPFTFDAHVDGFLTCSAVPSRTPAADGLADRGPHGPTRRSSVRYPPVCPASPTSSGSALITPSSTPHVD